ncbi:hypothetical protein PAI11_37520 [Patulibacter medicamentivorans]|uniref:Uncharacterized protein n=1 Tax=Patulibacter medicamentivorans TaxID=1097667 RepID=H0EA78_9ACTN|nr:hypothetical protein [Patulibacter medicamentivorans]EHN09418.1 hypothetical protein PAI11_37520 [Patulibacter medicamentivorans]
MPRQKAQTTTKQITRGPRKGQVVEIYVKSGTEVRRKTGVRGEDHTRVYSGSGTNRQRGNPRAGRKFTTTTNAKGQVAHVYADGTEVVVRGANKRRAVGAGRKIRAAAAANKGKAKTRVGTKPKAKRSK